VLAILRGADGGHKGVRARVLLGFLIHSMNQSTCGSTSPNRVQELRGDGVRGRVMGEAHALLTPAAP
jgi:hypothetical protein